MFNIPTFSIVSGEACCFPGTKTLSTDLSLTACRRIRFYRAQVLFIQSRSSPVFETFQIDEDTNIVSLALLAVGLTFHFHLVFLITARSLDSEEGVNHFKDTS